MTARTIDRPPRIITRTNSTVVDRASAWGIVERTQRAVNAAASRTPALAAAFARLDALLSRYHVIPDGTAHHIERADCWTALSAAQLALNSDARAIALPEVAQLDHALAWYVEIGGEPDRSPAHGGIG